MIGWKAVEEVISSAKCIYWDGCHKIYIGMDDEQTALAKSYGYGQDEDDSRLFEESQLSSDEMLAVLKCWYETSCGLRFINAVHTTEDPNEGFLDLIPQCYDPDEEKWN